MLISLLIFLLISNAVTLRRDKSILFSRITIKALFFTSFIARNNLDIKPLKKTSMSRIVSLALMQAAIIGLMSYVKTPYGVAPSFFSDNHIFIYFNFVSIIVFIVSALAFVILDKNSLITKIFTSQNIMLVACPAFIFIGLNILGIIAPFIGISSIAINYVLIRMLFAPLIAVFTDYNLYNFRYKKTIKFSMLSSIKLVCIVFFYPDQLPYFFASIPILSLSEEQITFYFNNLSITNIGLGVSSMAITGLLERMQFIVTEYARIESIAIRRACVSNVQSMQQEYNILNGRLENHIRDRTIHELNNQQVNFPRHRLPENYQTVTELCEQAIADINRITAILARVNDDNTLDDLD